MTSIKVKFRPDAVKDKEGGILLQVTHQNTTKQVSTSYKILPSEWDHNSQSINLATADNKRRSYLLAVNESVMCEQQLLMQVTEKLSNSRLPFTIDNIIQRFDNKRMTHSFFNIMQENIARLRQQGRIRTMQTYKAALVSFSKFRHDIDIPIDGINGDLLGRYEAWLKSQGLVMNTVSFYMRILRAAYNRAVDSRLITNQLPFRYVYTGIARTAKRAVSLNALRRIKQLNLHDNPQTEFARDIFMLSFYLRGMSFIDMAFLRKSDLRNGFLIYRRRKTGQMLQIKWEAEMQRLASKHSDPTSPYLLNIIKNVGHNERKQYCSASHLVNNRLKEVARMAHISANLTMYVSRHSWANAARKKNVPIAVISEGMGHESERTTRIYLKSIETHIVDRANRLVISGLR